MLMCTAHPAKGDLKEFLGLTAEEEENHQQCARAQLGAILYARPKNHLSFSKKLMKFADRHFVPSPPSTPERNRKRKRQPPRKQAAAAPSQEEEAHSESEEEPIVNESENLADMAAFWDEDDE